MGRLPALLIAAGLIISCLLQAQAQAQVVRPTAAVAPLAAIGEIAETQKTFLFNSLESLLSDSYLLISREEYRKA